MADTLRVEASLDSIPIIDLVPLFEGRPEAIGHQIRDASRDYGFFFIRNHGVGQDVVDGVFAAAESFFSQPDADKLKLKIDGNNIGFMPFKGSTLRTETLNNNTKPNLNESYFIMRERDPADPDVVAKKPFRGLNKWPDNLPSFRDSLLGYTGVMEALAKRLVEGFAAAFGVSMDYFRTPFADPQISLRLAHYPDQKIVGNNEFGIAPHTDFGFMTILAPTKVPGLEIRPKGKDWIRAPVLPDCFLVNTGDLLQRWTNDVFISTPHRVTNNTGKERYSIPFFFSPNSEYVVDTMDVFISEQGPKKYEPITYAELYGRAIRKNYDHLNDNKGVRVDVA